MRGVFFLLLIGIGLQSTAQGNSILSSDITSPALLSKELTADLSTDKQKVTAIFQWIANNISYNVKGPGKKNKTPLIFEEPDDTSRILKPLNERVAETVLRRRVAVCDGYSRLFKSLCDHAGIGSEIITGYARVNWDRSRAKFRSNHKWNAVLIDSSWYLLDVTWASGFISFRGDQFIKEYNEKYFLTPPDVFVQDHYPEDMSWTLLSSPPDLGEFDYSPFRYTGFIKSGITSYFPSKGIINAVPGDSIRFEIETFRDIYTFFVSDNPVPESDDDDPYQQSSFSKAEKKAKHTYAVTGDSPGWLYVACNGEVVLRYKLNVKKPEQKLALNSLPNNTH